MRRYSVQNELRHGLLLHQFCGRRLTAGLSQEQPHAGSSGSWLSPQELNGQADGVEERGLGSVANDVFAASSTAAGVCGEHMLFLRAAVSMPCTHPWACRVTAVKRWPPISQRDPPAPSYELTTAMGKMDGMDKKADQSAQLLHVR